MFEALLNRFAHPEAVVAAWQRALAQKGLTAGRFYAIYNEDVAVPIDDETVRKRFETKRDADLADIYERIHQVEVERSYRIIGALDHIANDIENLVIPRLSDSLSRWKKTVLVSDAVVLGALLAVMAVINNWIKLWGLFSMDFTNAPVLSSIKAAVIAVVVLGVHFSVRKFTARRMAGKLETETLAGDIRNAFVRNTRAARSLFHPAPLGWTSRSRRILAGVIRDASGFVQTMNDRFTNPSGIIAASPQAEILKVVEAEKSEQEQPRAIADD